MIIELSQRKANIVQGIQLVVLLRVWHVTEVSHDLDRYFKSPGFQWKTEALLTLSAFDQRNITLKNCLNAGRVF